RRRDRLRDFADVDDAHGHGGRLSKLLSFEGHVEDASPESRDSRVRCSASPRIDHWPKSLLVPEIRLHGAADLYGQRIAVAVLGVAGGDTHPALADTIFLDIGLLDALEANAHVARQNIRVVIRALRIDRQAVRQLIVRLTRLGLVLLVHNSASISFF